jgi:hypothetical protein
MRCTASGLKAELARFELIGSFRRRTRDSSPPQAKKEEGRFRPFRGDPALSPSGGDFCLADKKHPFGRRIFATPRLALFGPGARR